MCCFHDCRRFTCFTAKICTYMPGFELLCPVRADLMIKKKKAVLGSKIKMPPYKNMTKRKDCGNATRECRLITYA